MSEHNQENVDFQVSRVFSDDMVLQRGEYIRIWGFADPADDGKKIYGLFKEIQAEATVTKGQWCMTFPKVFEADTTGSLLRIYAGDKEVVFQDVLVGDVIMVMGQSNVEAEMYRHFSLTDPETHGGGEASVDPESLIRLNRTTSKETLDGGFPPKGSREVCRDYQNQTQWTRTTLEETLQFSAIGYFFGKQMVERSGNKIPYGIIEIGFSGMPIGAFLPNEVADALHTDTFDPVKQIYTTTGRNAKEGSGRFIYNRHIYPFERFAIAGVVWYQGESNSDITEAPYYNEKFCALIEHMRGTHNLIQKDFPVFIVELPSIYPKPEGYTGTDDLRWRYIELGMIRAFMGNIPKQLNNSYISAGGDVWGNKIYYNGLHPYVKYEQADRLADIAEAVILRQGTMEKAMGPILEKYQISDDGRSAVLSFENVGDCLATCDRTKEVRGIVGLAAKVQDYQAVTPETAKITGTDQIVITFKEPVKGLAYNFTDSDYYGETMNLCNSCGKPAAGFLRLQNSREGIA